MSSYSSDFVTGPEDICFQLLLPCLIPVLKEEFRNMYRVAATTNKPMTTEEAAARIEQMQRGRSTQDVMSLGVSFVRSPIMPRDFQKSLEQITKWNRFMIDKLYDRVCLSCGNSLVHIPIKTALYLPPAPQAEAVENDVKHPPHKGSAFSRFSSKLQNGIATKTNDADEMKIVAMSRGDYLRYWAKGADGNFKDNVVEPPEGRAEWLANALERHEREGLVKPNPRMSKGTYAGAAAVSAAGALIGGISM